MKNFIRKIFTKKPFENLLIFLLGKFPNNYFLIGIRPSNQLYHSPSVRVCKRYGINYRLDISDYQNWLLYYFCKADSSFGVVNYVQQGDTILDIGGNIGQTAMMIASKTGLKGKVYSFEPFPSTFQKFSTNLTLNPPLQSIITVTNCALGDVPASLKMYRDCDTNSGSNRMVNSNDQAETELIEVPVSTVDAFVATNALSKVNFIKIDVEGFEMNVLKGAEETLKKFSPSLFIELNDQSLKYQGSSANELITFLKNLGYRIFEDGKEEELNESDLARHIDIICKGKKV
ncbi:MAG: FkbM family methyltransferase [Bacteroidetes bacterium]|nr:FkbM family methyltransferase [Bacteroidota bacterium]